MLKIEKLQGKIELTKKFINHVRRGYGEKTCKTYDPNCFNCQAQWALGWLYSHKSLLEWELKEMKKELGE